MTLQKEVLDACNVLGKKLKIEFQTPPPLEGNAEEIVEQISSHSRIPFGKIILNNKWWRQGSIPLLTFDKNTSKPVVLVPTLSGRYRTLPLNKEQPKQIGKREALQLQRKGFCFYPQLPDKTKSLKDLFFYVLKEKKKELGILIFLALCGTLFALLPLFVIQWIFNHVFDQGTTDLGWIVSISLEIIAVAAALLIYIRNRNLLRLEGFLAHKIQPMFWQRIFELPVNFFKRSSKQSVFQKIARLEVMQQEIGHLSPQILFLSCSSLLYLIAMGCFSLSLTFLSFPFIGGAFWYAYRLIHTKQSLKEKIRKKEEKSTAFLSESLGHITNIRSWGQEKDVYKKLMTHLKENQKIKKDIGKAQTSLALIDWALPFLLLLLILGGVTLGWLIPRFGDLFAFFLAFLALCTTLATLTQMLLQLNNSVSLTKRSEKIFLSPSFSSSKTPTPDPIKGSIQLKNLSFQYPENAKPLFHNLSFDIAPKEKVAIVGPPGSGKTTLIRLLLGLESPETGTIFFDNHPLENLDLQKLRGSIGTVFETKGIFAGNIYENITVGRKFSMDQIAQTMSLTHFQKDLNSYPMGLSTILPENGLTLSSGEKQRLLLTRALVSNPTILLLDQAFCLLDPASRDEILAKLQKLPITQIFTTQNPAPLKANLDRIIDLSRDAFQD